MSIGLRLVCLSTRRNCGVSHLVSSDTRACFRV